MVGGDLPPQTSLRLVWTLFNEQASANYFLISLRHLKHGSSAPTPPPILVLSYYFQQKVGELHQQTHPQLQESEVILTDIEKDQRQSAVGLF